MASSMIRRIYNRVRPPRALNCPRSLWKQIRRQLRERGAGVRESGGFLLGKIVSGQRYVTDFIAYDDVDPGALQGIIVFDASKMDVVWRRCEADGLQVVADVHTHGRGFGQSQMDMDNPMIPQRGHIALIVPDFAQGFVKPGQFGMYEFCGIGQWRNHSRLGAKFMRLERFS